MTTTASQHHIRNVKRFTSITYLFDVVKVYACDWLAVVMVRIAATFAMYLNHVCPKLLPPNMTINPTVRVVGWRACWIGIRTTNLG